MYSDVLRSNIEPYHILIPMIMIAFHELRRQYYSTVKVSIWFWKWEHLCEYKPKFGRHQVPIKWFIWLNDHKIIQLSWFYCILLLIAKDHIYKLEASTDLSVRLRWQVTIDNNWVTCTQKSISLYLVVG